MITVEEDFALSGRGTTYLAVNLIIVCLGGFSFLHHVLVSRFEWKSTLSKVALFIIEVNLMTVGQLLLHTLWSAHLIWVAVITFALAILLSITMKAKVDPSKLKSGFQDLKIVVLMCTVVVIAAVDCRRIFDIRFTKTTRYGFASMDVGTGLFVYLRAAHDARPPHPQWKSGGGAPRNRLVGRLPNFVIFGALGLARSAFVALSGYYQDLFEYGQHWNFFLTLLVLEAVITLQTYLDPITRPRLPNIAAILGTIYVVGLALNPAFEQYLLGKEPRRLGGIFDQNREGICSVFGYLFVYGVLVEHFRRLAPSCFWYYDHMKMQRAKLIRASAKLAAYALACALLQFVLQTQFGQQPSRRVANICYCLWMMTIGFVGIAFIIVYQQLTADPLTTAVYHHIPPQLVHTSVSHNGAFVFILANILTGLLNYVRQPLGVESEAREYASMLAYGLALCAAAFALERDHVVEVRTSPTFSSQLFNVFVTSTLVYGIKRHSEIGERMLFNLIAYLCFLSATSLVLMPLIEVVAFVFEKREWTGAQARIWYRALIAALAVVIFLSFCYLEKFFYI